MVAVVNRSQRRWIMRWTLCALWAAVALLSVGCEGLPQAPEQVGVVFADSAIPQPPRLDEGVGGPHDGGPSVGDAEPPMNTLLNSVIPNRGPLEGGTRLRLVGREFSADLQVRLGDQPCLEVELESENHLRCTAPAQQVPGPVDVELRWNDGRPPAVLREGYHYYVPVRFDELSPTSGPTTGGQRVQIQGEGLIDPTAVWFGDQRARRVSWEDEETIVATAPAGRPGTVDVAVENANGSFTQAQAYTYVEPLLFEGLEPRWGWAEGGDAVRLRGAGLREDSLVLFGDAPAAVGESELERTRLQVHSPAGAPGLVDVRVENANGALTLAGAFLYVRADDGAFAVDGVVPGRVPNHGAGQFVVGGSGFEAEDRVLLGERELSCELVNSHIFECVAPALPAGSYDVSVEREEQRETLEDALYLYPAVALYDVQPERGAVAGGTLVALRGVNLDTPMTLQFDGAPLEIERVEPGGELLWARTPPGFAGLVDLVGETADQRVLLPEAYTYFNPRTRYGGVWGERIEQSVNLTVLNYLTAAPIEGAWVQAVGSGGEPLYTATTNAQGQVTISQHDLEAPLRITAAAVDYEVYTIDRVTQENVTIYLYPHVFEGNPGTGNQTPREPPRLKGWVRGLDQLDKPVEPGWALVAFVETTHTSQANKNAMPLPQPRGVLTEDGPFEIISRAGELAVVVTAGYVPEILLQTYREQGGSSWFTLRDSLLPLAMGHRRYLTVSYNRVLEDLQVTIDRPLALDVPVLLDNPSAGGEGAPTVFEARPVLHYGAEGYYALDGQVMGDSPSLRATTMPDLRDWEPDIDLRWIGVARTETWNPYTMTYHRQRDLEGGVVIGPFVGVPEMLTPMEEGASLGPTRRVSWQLMPGLRGPTTQADVNVVALTMPTGIPLWTWVTPGPIMTLDLPPLPVQLMPGGVIPGEMYLYVEPLILSERFNFSDFTYGDLGSRRSVSSRYLLVTD